MNVTTSQSAVIASNSELSSAQSQSKTSNNVKTSEKSFDEEMKSASKSEETKDIKESEKSKETPKDDKTTKQELNNKDNLKNNESKVMDEIVSPEVLNGEVNFTDFKYNNESQILSQNIQSLLNTKDLMSTVSYAAIVDYDSINMSNDDANFFANLVQRTDMSISGIVNEVSLQTAENSKNIQQNIKVSSILMEKLAESLKTNKPFRIDFDKDVSVIIKVNKDGSLSANFIPGDKAVEQYLRNNIASLRQRFDEENLSYSELSYSNSKEERQQRRKKENDNE